MKKLLIGLLCLCGCATTSSSLTADRPDIRNYCGEVETISVYANRRNGFVNCPSALKETIAALSLLKQVAGPLKEPWDAEYTYKYLQFVEPAGFTAGITYATEHVIKVREGNPRNIFHEMLHAYMIENSIADQHQTICQTHAWWKAESDYSNYPYYCYENGGTK